MLMSLKIQSKVIRGVLVVLNENSSAFLSNIAKTDKYTIIREVCLKKNNSV